MSDNIDHWLKKLDQHLTVQLNAELLYLLSLQYIEGRRYAVIKLVWSTRIKSGFSKPIPFSAQLPSHLSALTTQDNIIFQALSELSYFKDGYLLYGENSHSIWQALLASKKLFWLAPQGACLTEVAAQEVHFFWQKDNLNAYLPGLQAIILPLEKPYYFDVSKRQVGALFSKYFPKQFVDYLDVVATMEIYHQNETRRAAITEPIPIEKKHFKPKLHLFFFSDNKQAFVQCQFFYHHQKISAHDPRLVMWEVSEKKIVGLYRDIQQENALLAERKKWNLLITREAPKGTFLLQLNTQAERDRLANFLATEKNAEVDPKFSFISFKPDNWYMQVKDHQKKGWFEFDFGIEIEGKKINLLPFIQKYLQEEYQQVDPEQTHIYLEVMDKQLPIEKFRFQKMIALFNELQQQENIQHLKLSYLRASDVLLLQETLGATQARWLGSERLKKLAENLLHFKGIEEVALPTGFQAELRHYQQYGLNWLQFLRHYDLGGILADDMGLGKTIQTLAHLWTEKQQGRMKQPTLIIAPTSLVMNWYHEIKRFTPELNVLILHGSERSSYFDKISEYDLMITSYALLLRDYKILLQQEFYFLILDEAQLAKNPHSKSSKILLQLKAQHRLCLTGTPLENHLGELWSLFHFLLPGLLGHYTQFKRQYQIPIEKQQDELQKTILLQRVSPFILRRTKEQVLPELPKKTEMVRTIELTQMQRDYYETVLASLQHQLKLEKQPNHVLIFNSLLKLRQICCDPNLLNLTDSTYTERSAKIDLLLTLLPNLIEEGRRILLFSSFASLLYLLEPILQNEKIPYLILTGKSKNRHEIIHQFQTSNVPLFLISLKAGGLGLNLAQADTVIHFDPWWNPAAEMQATSRAHRIGQKNPVFVYKLIAANTIEEKIIQLQEQKSRLAKQVLSSDLHTQGLTMEELNFLLT